MGLAVGCGLASEPITCKIAAVKDKDVDYVCPALVFFFVRATEIQFDDIIRKRHEKKVYS